MLAGHLGGQARSPAGVAGHPRGQGQYYELFRAAHMKR
jgi:hypothetical protein